MRKYLLCALICVALSVGVLFAEKASSVQEENIVAFEIANNFYQQGKYSEAIKEYEKFLNDGTESAPILYNLANAYYKSGKIGKAIVNYERALRLMPRDADMNANFNYAKAQIKARVFSDKGFWAWRPLNAYVKSFTINELTIFSSAIYALVLFLGVVALLRPEAKRSLFLAGILLIILGLLNFFIIWHKVEIQTKYAITVVSGTDAMFGPFEAATKFFKLHEGMSVIILKSKDDWDKVRRADGKIGWIKKDVLEIV